MGFFSEVVLVAFVFFVNVQYSVSYYNREAGLVFDSYPKQKLKLPNDLDGVKPNKSVSVKDKMDCVFACINVPWCRSVNFQTTPLKSGLHFCQLLSSEQFTHRNYLKKNKLYLHYSVKNLCQEKPCRNGGQCIFQNNRQEYKCICKEGISGQDCEIDIDECSTGKHNCHANARCANNVGSYNCACNSGYQGDGRSCSDIDECSTGKHNCHANARCTNNLGSYNCACNSGYQGDGRSCSDIDECSTGKHNCHANARCTNNVGSYNCACNSGYQGDGRSCSDIDECSTGKHNCHAYARCTNNAGSYTCACNSDYYGNGRSCSDLVTVSSSGCTAYSVYSRSSGRSGTIHSPGYPNSVYPNNVKCQWLFRTFESNGKIQITFDVFELEDTTNHDLVDIYDGSSSSARKIGHYHAKNKPGTIHSTFSYLYITFQTDRSVQKKGFTARYRGIT